jgi:threonine dehydrogenase-like Zn-dependent dehydrogenase
LERFSISVVGADISEETIMHALCWHGKGDVRVDTVPDPKIQHPRDAVIKITACAICGSDLHLLDGYQPTMESATFSVMRTWAR